MRRCLQCLVPRTEESRDIHNHEDFCAVFVDIQVVLVANVMSENHLDCWLDGGKALIKNLFCQ